MPLNFGYNTGQNAAGGGSINNLTVGAPMALSSLSPDNFIDTYAPKLAFSLRKLSNEDTFPIIRVRKSTTQEEIDFFADTSGWVSEYSTGSGANASIQLGTWCSGVNCFVSKWYNQAKNPDASRYVNDYFQNTSANQFKIWDASTGLTKSRNQNSTCFAMGANSQSSFDLQTPINTRSFVNGDFSVFMSGDNPFIQGNYDLSFVGNQIGLFSGLGGIQRAATAVVSLGEFGSITPVLEQLNVTPFNPFQPDKVFDFHSKKESEAARYVSAYTNNYRVNYLNGFTDADFSPNNSRGLKLLPSGSITTTGVRVNVGISHDIPGYDSSVVIGSAPNYVDSAMSISGIHIDAFPSPIYSLTSDYIKTGHTVRLIATSAPSSNPVIGGKTYTYVQIGSYWWLAENLETTTYPNASAISQVTTDAAWGSATSGVYRSYEALYGKYYNRAAINTIISQGGYTAGGTTWTIPTNLQLVVGLAILNTTVTKGNSSLNLASRTLMYQLTDQEYQNAGNTGKWTESQYFKIGYNIGDKILMGPKLLPEEFVLFDSCRVNTRSEISAILNNPKRKFVPPFPQVLDMFPGARGAYSLRRIRKSVDNIPIIEIKNLTTNGIALIFTNYLGDLDTDTINSFCSGATCVVKTWYDQSGREYNLTQSTDSAAPIIYQNGAIETVNGKPALLFNGNRFIGNSTIVTLGVTQTLFAVIDPGTNLEGDAIAIEAPGISLKKYADQGEWSILGNPNISSNGGEIVSYVEMGEAVHYGKTSASTQTIEHAVNLKVEKQNTGSALSVQTFTVGATAAGANKFVGHIKEILYYQNDKSYDRFEIQNELNKKYNLHNDLVTTISAGEIRPAIRFAYSFRRVNGTYTGPLVRIRRSSDNKETDIFPDINGEISLNSRVSADNTISYTNSTPNLGQFLNADGYKLNQSSRFLSYITKWYDQSLYQEHIINPTTAEQPQFSDATDFIKANGKIAASFSSNRLYTENASASPINFYSPNVGTDFPLSAGSLCVVADIGGSSVRTIFAYTSETGSTTSSYDHRTIISSGGAASSTYVNTTPTVYSSFSTSTLTANNQYIITGSKAGTILTTSATGENTVSTGFSGTLRTNTPKYFVVGSTARNTSSSPFSGKIQEIIHFNNHINGFRKELELEAYRYYNTPTYNYNYSTILTVANPYSNAFAAYSLRVLNQNIENYVGVKLVRVRRSTDNIEVDVFADNFGTIGYSSYISEVIETTVTAGQKGSSLMRTFGEFINGADGFLVTWYDQSGNARDITQATSASQPKIYDINTGIIQERARPAVKFISANNTNLVSSALTLIGDTCLLAIYQTAANTTEYVLHGSGSAPIRYGRNITSTSNRDEAYITSGLATAIATQVSRSAFVHYAASGGISLNKANLTTGSIGVVNTTALYIGSSNTSTNAWSGTIQELILWNSNISQFAQETQEKVNTYYRIF